MRAQISRHASPHMTKADFPTFMPNRILVLTPRFPYPLYAGDLLRIYRLCESLQDSFSLTLLSICQTRAEMEAPLPEGSPFAEVHRVYLPKWRSYLNTLWALVTGRSMQLAYYSSSAYAQALSRLQDGHGFMLCHLARMAPFADHFSGTKVLELTDFIPQTYARSNALQGKSLSLRRLIYTLERDRVERAQNCLAPKFDLITFVSDVDRAMFLESSGILPGKVATFGNGVSLHERPFRQGRCGKTLAFIGSLKAMPNADAVSHFITRVMPIIHRSQPDVKLRVVGAVDKKFKADHESSHVQFTGSVPDLAHSVEECVLGICPVRIGAGVQNKMLDYMALGLPAVTTPIGAEGLKNPGGGAAFLVADGDNEFATTIVSLLNDMPLRKQLAQTGRHLMEAAYSWEGSLATFPERILAARNNTRTAAS